jgi:hypothetical protein
MPITLVSVTGAAQLTLGARSRQVGCVATGQTLDGHAVLSQVVSTPGRRDYVTDFASDVAITLVASATNPQTFTSNQTRAQIG